MRHMKYDESTESYYYDPANSETSVVHTTNKGKNQVVPITFLMHICLHFRGYEDI
jgi:hypothetical protein